MRQLNENKLFRLHSANDLLDKKYGEVGSENRAEFNEKAVGWYYGEIVKNKRKELKLTQQQLADRVGKERSYIARIEKGETDIQLSSLVHIADALGLKIALY